MDRGFERLEKQIKLVDVKDIGQVGDDDSRAVESCSEPGNGKTI